MSDAEVATSDTTSGYAAAYASFLERHPSYAETAGLDELRVADYARLDRLGHIYLDYTGGSLYPESLLREHLELLSDSVLGNPHSHNPTSAASTGLVEEARAVRARVLPGLAGRVRGDLHRQRKQRAQARRRRPIRSSPVVTSC